MKIFELVSSLHSTLYGCFILNVNYIIYIKNIYLISKRVLTCQNLDFFRISVSECRVVSYLVSHVGVGAT